MSDLETKFRHLEIFPGVMLPLTYDARTDIVAGAVEGNLRQIKQTLDALILDGLWDYLSDLLDVPVEKIEELAASLREARGKYLGLPVDASYQDVLAAEKKGNRCLTIGALRIERDKRKGTHIPLVNGEW